jgi:hypothetical protein
MDEIMNITGHSSNSSARRYVANSFVQKKKATDLTSLKGLDKNVGHKRNFSSVFPTNNHQDPAAPITINITLSGNAQMNEMSIFK